MSVSNAESEREFVEQADRPEWRPMKLAEYRIRRNETITDFIGNNLYLLLLIGVISSFLGVFKAEIFYVIFGLVALLALAFFIHQGYFISQRERLTIDITNILQDRGKHQHFSPPNSKMAIVYHFLCFNLSDLGIWYCPTNFILEDDLFIVLNMYNDDLVSIEWLMRLEEKYGIKVPDLEMERFLDLPFGDFIDYILKQI